MLTLNDGRAELWQWDTGRTLAVDADCSQVHFSNKVFGRSIDVDVVNGAAIIPDVLLQTDKDLNVWAFVGTAENGYTKISKTFKVNRRNKPSDYVFTPTEQTTLAELVGQIGNLDELTTEAKDNLVAAINEAAKSGGGGGTTDHTKLTNRNADDQHPMSAITGLVGALGCKVSVADIINNLTTNAADKPLSASQGVAIKAMIDAITVPDKLPNPNELTFTGAVTGSYDGSAPLTVEIPSGGGSTVNNNTINQYFYNSMATGKYDLKSGYGATADIYIATDGTETAISGLDYVATDYIPVGANTTYVAYCNGYALYDREKTFVSAVIDRSNYGTIKEFTPEQDGYARITYRLSGDGTMRNFSRFCEKSEIKKAPRDYMPAPSPLFDSRIPCNVDLYGDSNSYGYGLSDKSTSWANRLGTLLLSMPGEITNGARCEMSVFAGTYSGFPKLRNNGVVYMSAYTDKFTVNGEYITAVDVYIDGVQQEQMTASPAEYTCPLGYHEIELRGSSGANNIIRSVATNKTRSFTNHAVTGSKSDNLPDTVDGNVEIVMYGTNDRETAYGSTANNMARFYSACEAAGAKVYFLSPIPTKVEGETAASYVQTISDVISQIPDINYIDVYKDMQLYSRLSTETLYSDKLHLNDLGHKVLFCIVASKLHLAALNSIF